MYLTSFEPTKASLELWRRGSLWVQKNVELVHKLPVKALREKAKVNKSA